MTRHLKDRELEKKLIAIDPEFIDKLQMTKGYGNYGFYLNLGGYVYSGDCGVPKIQIYLVPEDLEEVQEYNRHDWNKFPVVKPPYNMMMRIEMYNGLGFAGFFKHFIEGDQWCYADGSPMPKAYSNNVKRYRPWCED